MFMPAISQDLAVFVVESGRCIACRYFGFIKLFPFLNLDSTGALYERKETSLWRTPASRSTEISEECSEAIRVDKKRG